MKMSAKVWGFAFAIIAGTTLVSMPVSAKEGEKELTGSYNVSAKTELQIDFGVGSIRFEPTSAEQVEVTVLATADDDFNWRKNDLDAVELVTKQRGDRLQLSVSEEDDIAYEWVVKLPQMAALDLDLGVGEVKGQLQAMDINIDVGVGEVELLVNGAVGRINADVGVGDSVIRGLSEVESNRYMVAASSNARGSGKAKVNVDVGVGEITLTIKE